MEQGRINISESRCFSLIDGINNDGIMKVVAMFDRGGVLGGISPAEELLKHKDKNI
jgi:hypothetical protein